MSASSSDFFTHVGTPGTATTLDSPGHSISGTSLTVISTSNWPTDTGVIFAVDTFTLVNGVAVRDTGSYTEWEGVVTDSTTIGSLVLREGTDQNYPAGSTTRVYIPVASSFVNRLADGVLVAHNQDGTHKSGATYLLPTIASFANANHDHSNSAGGGPVNLSNSSNPYKFSVYRNASQNSGSGAFAVVGFDTALYDTGSNVDLSTNKGRFTAPVSGFYHFDAGVQYASNSVGCQLAAYKNGSSTRLLGIQKGNAYAVAIGGSFDIQLAASDYIEIEAYADSTTALTVGAPGVWFTGHIVSKT